MKLKRAQKTLPAFSQASMTDIVLQLLIFFLLSSSFVVMPGIKVQLPKSETTEAQADRQTIITLTKSGRLFLNADEVSKTSLGQKLIPIIDVDRNAVIIIKADRDVDLQTAVEVMDIAKGVGAQRFMIATLPLEGK